MGERFYHREERKEERGFAPDFSICICASSMYVRTIKKRSEFVKLNKFGYRVRTTTLLLICLRDEKLIGFEVGYTASKKVGKAVKRNFAKRRMRHVVLELLANFEQKYRFVFVANTNTAECKFSKLLSDARYCLEKVKRKYCCAN